MSQLEQPIDAATAYELFKGPPRLRWLVPSLRSLPPAVATGALMVLAITNGLARPHRRRAVLAWSRAHAPAWPAQWQLAFSVLAHHGRFIADELMLGAEDGAWRQETTVEGGEHLDRLNGRGAILLGFHLGPPKVALRLRALGYPVYFTGRMASAESVAAQRLIDASGGVRFPSKAPEGRAMGLQQLRVLLRAGHLVYITADGPFGRELFGIDVPGGRVSVRPGWHALRRAARVPVLPVLSARQPERHVIVVHPPLDDLAPDPAEDMRLCEAALAPLVDAYVRRYPEQCRWLAIQRWPRNPLTPV